LQQRQQLPPEQEEEKKRENHRDVCLCMLFVTIYKIGSPNPFRTPNFDTSQPSSYSPTCISPFWWRSQNNTQTSNNHKKKHLEMHRNVLGVFGLYSFLSSLLPFRHTKSRLSAPRPRLFFSLPLNALLHGLLLSAIILLHRIQHSTFAVILRLLCVLLLLPPICLPSNIWLFNDFMVLKSQLCYHFGLFQQETISSVPFSNL